MKALEKLSHKLKFSDSPKASDTYLAILAGNLRNSVQQSTEIEAWLLLTFFICLHN